MMGGVRRSMGLFALCLVVMSTEAAAVSELSKIPSETIKTVEYEQIPPANVFETDAESGVIERTHDVRLFSEEDELLLEKIATAEGLSEGEDGMYLIMSVVINRKNSSRFPDSIRSVIYQDHQFSSVSDGNFDKVDEISEECKRAFDRINAGEIAPEIIAFETKDSKVLDQYFMPAFEYRHHKFYTEKD